MMARALAAGLLMVFSVAALAEDIAAVAPEAPPAPATLDELVEMVRSRAEVRRAELAAREARFIRERDQRASMLADIRQRREAAEAEADRLAKAFETGEQELADLETKLQQQSGNLDAVFSVVHQVAGDALPLIEGSLVSAELGDRTGLISQLAGRDHMPTAAEMREMWLVLLEEINVSGKTTRFETDVISADGEEMRRNVTRFGTFTAVSEGDYLRYLPESGRLLALSRQPIGADPARTRAFEAAEEDLITLPIDPSRGAILALVVQRTDFVERIHQGGIIGYLILLLGLVGLLLGLERIVVVYSSHRRQASELSSNTVGGDGPIGLLRTAAADPDYRHNADAMSAKMDEIIATANQRLGRGLPTLAIIAAVSPLLGLLGTVTGMIETFQVITLFGAGDPRLMSGGISQALITTQLGLSVAIPLLLIHSFVQGRVNSQVAALDETAANLFAAEQAAS